MRKRPLAATDAGQYFLRQQSFFSFLLSFRPLFHPFAREEEKGRSKDISVRKRIWEKNASGEKGRRIGGTALDGSLGKFLAPFELAECKCGFMHSATHSCSVRTLPKSLWSRDNFMPSNADKPMIHMLSLPGKVDSHYFTRYNDREKGPLVDKMAELSFSQGKKEVKQTVFSPLP